jgi:predicted component of type VI protein secretion system
MTTPTDPMNMFRDVVNQWEKLANEYGSQLLARPEAAQAMHSVTSAGLQVQNAVQEAMAKVLNAANMPSKAEIETLGQRLTSVEASLARIEAMLSGGSHAASPVSKPKPTRGRKPAPAA